MDYTGRKFHRYTVLKSAGYQGKSPMLLCRCDCGTERLVQKGNLIRGRSRSCGCLQREELVARNIKHGLAPRGKKSSEFIAWRSMMQRCVNPKNHNFPNYGARGITVCAQWSENYANFLEDMGPKPSHVHSLERIDNNGNYEPGNCKWALPREQNRNRRNVHTILVEGNHVTLKEACDYYGAYYPTVRRRIYKGITLEEAIGTPIRGRIHKRKSR